MMKVIVLAVVLVLLSGEGTEAGDCCGSYKDITGAYHPSELCADYCCIDLSIAYKSCCSDISRKIPATKNQDDDCVRDWISEQDWISEHVWVPIVGGIVTLIILIGICTCCCCCCGCCRRTPAPVVIHSNGFAQPSTTVAMANTTTNQYHAGYNQ